jgi:hypothetical protein
MVDKDLMNRLVGVIEAGLKPRADVTLRVIGGGGASPHKMHPLDRESHCRMIRHFRRTLGASGQMLIDQAVFGLGGIEQLSDESLISLHQDMEKAMECVREGISFEDAGLIRYRYG